MRLRSPDIATRSLGGETIVLNLATSRYFAVSGVGVRLLELLGEETSPADLVDVITREYDVETLDAERDVMMFLDRLRAAELLA